MANDLHPELIAFWNAYVHFGFELPYISEDFYNAVKRDRSLASKALQGYMGFNFGFGGKYFDSFTGSRTQLYYNHHVLQPGDMEKIRNTRALKHMSKQLPKLQGVEFKCQDYRDLIIPDNSIIYCDPPYISIQQNIRKESITKNSGIKLDTGKCAATRYL
jgi:DNA adenine methylase